MIISKETKIADLLKEYPFLKDKLITRNSRFKNLNNSVVFNTVGKFARLQDIAKVSGENLNGLITFINEEIENKEVLPNS